MEEADQCPEIWSEPDPQSTIHFVVVSHNQQSECMPNSLTVAILISSLHSVAIAHFFCFCSLGIRGFPGAAGSYWNLHAWQNSHPQDLPDPDLQSSLVAEDS